MAAVEIADGRASLYQWDAGVRLKVSGCSEVHLARRRLGSSYDSPVSDDGMADVPDVLLQAAGTLHVWCYDTSTSAVTVEAFEFPIVERAKPAGYSYSASDRKTIADAEAARDEAKGHAEAAKASAEQAKASADSSAKDAGDVKAKLDLVAGLVAQEVKGSAPIVATPSESDVTLSIQVGDGLKVEDGKLAADTTAIDALSTSLATEIQRRQDEDAKLSERDTELLAKISEEAQSREDAIGEVEALVKSGVMVVKLNGDPTPKEFTPAESYAAMAQSMRDGRPVYWRTGDYTVVPVSLQSGRMRAFANVTTDSGKVTGVTMYELPLNGTTVTESTLTF